MPIVKPGLSVVPGLGVALNLELHIEYRGVMSECEAAQPRIRELTSQAKEWASWFAQNATAKTRFQEKLASLESAEASFCVTFLQLSNLLINANQGMTSSLVTIATAIVAAAMGILSVGTGAVVVGCCVGTYAMFLSRRSTCRAIGDDYRNFRSSLSALQVLMDQQPRLEESKTA